MRSELEQEFYDTFEIKKKCNRETLKFCVGSFDCNTCKSPLYPKISAEKLLEIICILNDYEGIDVQGTTIEELKEELLNQCIEYFKYPIAFEENADLCNLHNKIQQLFKEDNQ